MKRQSLTDGSGRWFDVDAADMFDEDTLWDGNNHISKATGSQWDHEELYRTASGLLVKRSWSQWQGSGQTWEEVSHQDAAGWLIANGHDPVDELEEATKALEM